MSQELGRFLKLFDALVIANNSWMAGLPAKTLDWVPFDNENMKFGDRISTITIKSVYVHIIVGECGWARMLKDCEDGASIKPAREEGAALTKQLMESRDFVADAMKLHAANMQKFASYGDAQLEKKIEWSGRQWTIMGFLWGIYSHRSYHLGNIDILLREADAKAPDFFSSFQPVMA
ncbi:MAG: hypothetical protein HY056_09940 [Proteobacteria bacterium]|nr:hypothetical protein [Pseudomonadota bacterium]